MRVSCGCPKELASEGLIEEIIGLGVQPIVTTEVIRAVYEGSDKRVGEAIVLLFEKEAGHDVTVQLNEEEQRRHDRKYQRKLERAKKNAKLHGH